MVLLLYLLLQLMLLSQFSTCLHRSINLTSLIKIVHFAVVIFPALILFQDVAAAVVDNVFKSRRDKIRTVNLSTFGF
jgi:hypothetical protein